MSENKVNIVFSLSGKDAVSFLEVVKIVQFIYKKNKKKLDISDFNKAVFLCGLNEFVGNILLEKEQMYGNIKKGKDSI